MDEHSHCEAEWREYEEKHAGLNTRRREKKNSIRYVVLFKKKQINK